VATFHKGRLDANIVGNARARTLDVEPNYGASGGAFNNPGYQVVGVNLNWRVRGNMTFYANVHNVFNQRYEETYGFPAPLLNVVAGVKWSLVRAR
jgi:outer membrane receptor protein involved in Fe transport